MVFNLKSECYFVNGATGSCMYNLLTGEILHFDNTESDIILNALDGNDVGEDTLLKELSDMGWGFFSEKRYFIDKLRPYNDFMMLRPDLRSPVLNVAFLQLIDQCPRSHEHCRSMFCTPCRRSRTYGDLLTTGQWKQIIDMLCLAGTNNIILTGGDVTLYDGLKEVIDYIVHKKRNLSIVINSSSNLDGKIDSNIPIVVYVCDTINLDAFADKLRGFRDVTVMCNEEVSQQDIDLFHSLNFKVRHIKAYDSHISRTRMTPCYMNQFFDKKDYNDCLKEKMYVDSYGNVLPCLQSDNIHIGNILNDDFNELYRKLIVTYWKSPTNHTKCSVCEWYYSCPVCTFIDPEMDCRYNVEKARWE